MASENLILMRYATALHELTRESGTHEQVEAELGDLGRLLQGQEDLRRQLEDPRIPRSVKRSVLEQILGDGCSELTRRTLLLMTDKGRANMLAHFPAVYDAVAMRASGRQVAQVQSAVPLDEQARSGLREQLCRVTGKDITLEESVDESLLGGLRVIIGSHMIDGSLKRRLETLSHKMLSAPLGTVG